MVFFARAIAIAIRLARTCRRRRCSGQTFGQICPEFFLLKMIKKVMGTTFKRSRGVEKLFLMMVKVWFMVFLRGGNGGVQAL